ncbi:adenylyl-sulfate kinase [Frankia sp. R82]|uniref:adenylyl-sulfate kinase n=1 Tax=Frankia sp. R82 TaxID=2950553 RepID=UPI002044B164|nr:adenylyl-sulfate kinase [Frankia sp. R82]MCM3884246.1 adenylyl-sulfate kinase [Frankia sp. R82]
MSATSHPDPDRHDASPTGGDPLLTLVGPARAAELTAASRDWPSLTLTPRQLAELELLLVGAFGPHPGYPAQDEVAGVPVPALIVAAGSGSGAQVPEPGTSVALRDAEGVMIAVLQLRATIPVVDPRSGLDSSAGPDPDSAAGANSGSAPGGVDRVRLVGEVEGVRLPDHPDHPNLRLTPDGLRAELRARGWIGPQVDSGAAWAVWADGLLHTADVGRIRALTRQGKRCVVLAPVGGADPADARYHLRVRCLLAALDAVDAPLRPSEATLASEALASDALTAGGAGRHREPTPDPYRRPGAGEASHGRQSLLVLVPAVPSPLLVTPREPGMSATILTGPSTVMDGAAAADHEWTGRATADAAGTDEAAELARLTAQRAQLASAYGLSGSLIGPAIGAPGRDELASLLDAGGPIPAELTPPTVAAELTRAVPPRSRRGLTVLFTGLSGSGKSTLAGLLVCRLLEEGGRRVTLLDGDVVRTHLSKGLGFDRADRDTNVRRIGFVAAQVAGAGGTAVCAPIAPYAEVRAEVREMVRATGAGFVLVHVATPVEVCEARDRKGLYAKARAGVIPAFTGVSDPYEVPDDADVTVDTARLSPQESVDRVLDHLRLAGWLGQ